MELEVGLKITKRRDDLTTTNFWIAKDKAGPLFLSRETDTMFILTAHLKGFRRRDIKIDINEDGTQIAISGEKPVQEMVLVGWKMYEKALEMRGFRKTFRIPDGVVLDRIKAKFNDEETILKILMPKLVKGVRGVEIEEVKQEQLERGAPETMQIVAGETSEREDVRTTFEQETIEPQTEDIKEIMQKVDTLPEESAAEPRKALEESTPEKIEPAPTTVTYPETGIAKEKEVKPQSELGQPETTGPSLPKATQIEEFPALKEEAKKEEIPEAENKIETGGSQKHEYSPEMIETSKGLPEQEVKESEFPKSASVQQAQVEEKHTIDEIPQAESKMPQQESEKQRTDTHIQEEPKLKPDHKLEQTATSHPGHPTNKEHEGEEVHGLEGSHGTGNEIQEEPTDQAQLPEEKVGYDHEFAQLESDKGPTDQAMPAQVSPPKKSKLCSPCFFAGSAFLVTLIVLVINLIRSKKR